MQFALVWRLLMNEQNQLNLASAHYLYVYHDSMYKVANKTWDRKEDLKLHVQGCQQDMRP